MPVAFGTNMEGGTRAMHAISNNNALAMEGGFGVFASYTGLYKFNDVSVTSDFMYNQHVTWDAVNTQWIYEPLKYWPNGESSIPGLNPHYVSFFAYAPYSDNDPGTAAGYCITTFHYQHEKGNPWLTYRLHYDVDRQVDLLYAQLLDQPKPDVSTRLPLQFKHALACVGDKVTVACAEELCEWFRNTVDGDSHTSNIMVRVNTVDVSYTLTEKGRLTLWNDGEPNWQLIESGAPTTTRDVSLTSIDTYELPYALYNYDGSDETSNVWQDLGHGLFYIPLHINGHEQTVSITVSYDIVVTTDGEEETQTYTKNSAITLSDYPSAYEAGQGLQLNIILTGEGDIAVRPVVTKNNVTDWVDGGTTDVPDFMLNTQTP